MSGVERKKIVIIGVDIIGPNELKIDIIGVSPIFVPTALE